MTGILVPAAGAIYFTRHGQKVCPMDFHCIEIHGSKLLAMTREINLPCGSDYNYVHTA